MGTWVDCPGGMLLDATLAVTVLSSLVVMALLGCRQPAQRLRLARTAILGALALIPLTWLASCSTST
jgi:bla regulator protein blaR1